MQYLNYLFLVFFLALCSNAEGQSNASNGPIIYLQETIGPRWVKGELVKAGVLNTPDFSFTNDFEAYQEFSIIKGLFFNGLDYVGKQTKVFCWMDKGMDR